MFTDGTLTVTITNLCNSSSGTPGSLRLELEHRRRCGLRQGRQRQAQPLHLQPGVDRRHRRSARSPARATGSATSRSATTPVARPPTPTPTPTRRPNHADRTAGWWCRSVATRRRRRPAAAEHGGEHRRPQFPALALSLLLIASLGALVSVRLAGGRASSTATNGPRDPGPGGRFDLLGGSYQDYVVQAGNAPLRTQPIRTSPICANLVKMMGTKVLDNVHILASPAKRSRVTTHSFPLIPGRHQRA